MRHMKFDVQSHPTKETPGVTVVHDEHVDANGVITHDVVLGNLTKTRGEPGYRAAAYVDGADTLTDLDGLFATRSKAGHAVRAAAEANARSAKKTDAPAPAVAETKAEVLTIEQVAERLSISRSAALKRAKRGTSVKKVDGGYEVAA